MSLGCSFLRSYPIEQAMGWFVLLGDGLLIGGVGIVLLLYGLVARNQFVRQVGLAALLAILAAGLLANLLKLIVQLPRPDPGGGLGFPSGHTSMAFGLASVLGQALPSSAPLFYFLGLLAGVARLYDRSHFVLDIIGGGLLGSGCGLLLARTLFDRLRPRRTTPWAWAVPVVFGVVTLGFFAAYEWTIGAHRPVPLATSSSPRVVIRFGTPEARPLLLEGWSGDEEGGVWVEGVASRLRLPSLALVDHRIHLRVQPYVSYERRPTCQLMEVAVNGVPAARFLVEKGEREYELNVPKRLIRPGANELGFRFAYAESPARGAITGDRRELSVAFALLEAFVDEEGAR